MRKARGVNRTGGLPQLRLGGLVETGTHVICGAQLGSYQTSEVALATEIVSRLSAQMLCLADRVSRLRSLEAGAGEWCDEPSKVNSIGF